METDHSEAEQESSGQADIDAIRKSLETRKAEIDALERAVEESRRLTALERKYEGIRATRKNFAEWLLETGLWDLSHFYELLWDGMVLTLYLEEPGEMVSDSVQAMKLEKLAFLFRVVEPREQEIDIRVFCRLLDQEADYLELLRRLEKRYNVKPIWSYPEAASHVAAPPDTILPTNVTPEQIVAQIDFSSEESIVAGIHRLQDEWGLPQTKIAHLFHWSRPALIRFYKDHQITPLYKPGYGPKRHRPSWKKSGITNT